MLARKTSSVRGEEGLGSRWGSASRQNRASCGGRNAGVSGLRCAGAGPGDVPHAKVGGFGSGMLSNGCMNGGSPQQPRITLTPGHRLIVEGPRHSPVQPDLVSQRYWDCSAVASRWA